MKNNGNDKKETVEVKFPNLIPLLYFEYRTAALNYLKNVFLDNLLACIKAEREYCKAHNLEPAMTQEKVDQIQSILDKCTNVYEIQALNDFVFLENYVPTWEEVRQRGLRLKLLYPSLEAKRPTKVKGKIIKLEEGGRA